MPRYPEIVVPLGGTDADHPVNAVFRVLKALERHNVPQEEVEEYKREVISGDWLEAFLVINKWVSIG